MEQSYKHSTINYSSRSKNRISFRAIIAGVIMAIITQLLLSLLGMGIGLVNFTPTTDASPLSGFGTGSIIWLILTILISLFIGGWVSGRLSGSLDKSVRMLHGALTWAIYTLFSIYLVTTSVGKILGGVGSLIGSGFSAAGSVISSTMPNVGEMIENNLNISVDNQDLVKLKNEAKTILKQTEKASLQPGNLENKAEKAASEIKATGKDVANNPNAADVEVDNLLGKLFSMSEDVMSDVDKQALVNVVSNRTGKSKAEAEVTVNNWIETAESVKQSAREVADAAKEKAQEVKESAIEVSEDVSDSIGQFAIYSFFALLLSGVCAVVGSAIVKNQDIIEEL